MVGRHGQLSLPRFHRSWRRLRAAWTLQGLVTLPHIFGSIAQYFHNHCTTFAHLLYDKKFKGEERPRRLDLRRLHGHHDQGRRFHGEARDH